MSHRLLRIAATVRSSATLSAAAVLTTAAPACAGAIMPYATGGSGQDQKLFPPGPSVAIAGLDADPAEAALALGEATPGSARGHGDRLGWQRRVVAPLSAIRRLYGELRVAWREGGRFPPELPVRDYPIARR
jgi:hypothetical protein